MEEWRNWRNEEMEELEEQRRNGEWREAREVQISKHIHYFFFFFLSSSADFSLREELKFLDVNPATHSQQVMSIKAACMDLRLGLGLGCRGSSSCADHRCGSRGHHQLTKVIVCEVTPALGGGI